MAQDKDQLDEILSTTIVFRYNAKFTYRDGSLKLNDGDYAFVSESKAGQLLREEPVRFNLIENLQAEEKKSLFLAIDKSVQVDADTKLRFPIIFESKSEYIIRERIKGVLKEFQSYDSFEYWEDFKFIRIEDIDYELNNNQRKILKYIVKHYGYMRLFRGMSVINKVKVNEMYFYEAFKSNQEIRKKLFELMNRSKGQYRLVLQPKKI